MRQTTLQIYQQEQYIKLHILEDIPEFMTILPNGDVKPIKLNEGAIVTLHHQIAQVLLEKGWAEAI